MREVHYQKNETNMTGIVVYLWGHLSLFSNATMKGQNGGGGGGVYTAGSQAASAEATYLTMTLFQ